LLSVDEHVYLSKHVIIWTIEHELHASGS